MNEINTDTQRDSDQKNGTQNKIQHILAELAEASGLDRHTCEQIFNLYVKQSVDLLQQLNRILPDNNYDEMRGLLHKLKGSSGNVRATDVMDLTKASELAINEMRYADLKDLMMRITEELLGYQQLL